MKKEDKVRFAKVIAVLEEVYEKEISRDLSAIYFQILQDFDISQIERAAKEIIQTRVYPSFPKPAEIIERIEGKKVDKAVLAWVTVVKALQTASPYDSVNLGDTKIHEVIQIMGGWPAVCLWTNEELKWKEKEFEKIYSAMDARTSGAIAYLPGTTEIQNAPRGFHFDSPKQLGGPAGRAIEHHSEVPGSLSETIGSLPWTKKPGAV